MMIEGISKIARIMALAGFAQVAFAIGNGTNVPQGKYPFFTVFDTDKSVPISNKILACGGVLVAKHWVMTAKHCYSSEGSISNLRLIIGSSDLSDPTSYQVAYAQKLFYAPADPYIDPAKGTYNDYWQANDILLVRLDRDVTLPPVEIADVNSKMGDSAIVMGRGITQSGELPAPQLKELTLPIVAAGYCDTNALANVWPDIMRIVPGRDICAGVHDGTYRNAGSGDSGGPLIQNRNGKYYLLGIVSRGLPLEDVYNYGGIYMNLNDPYLNNWIKEITNSDN